MADWRQQPTLATDRVVLRPFEPGDDQAMATVLDDPELLRLTGSVTSSGEAALGYAPDARHAEWYATRGGQVDRLDLAVIDRHSGELVGEVVLNELDASSQSCNLRILIGAHGRDRGLGTDAVRLITAYGLETLGLHRISLEVYAFNPRARAVYEKAGYRLEGTLREALRWDDGWVDTHVMAILATDDRPGIEGTRARDASQG